LINFYYTKDQIYAVQNQVYNYLLEDHPELAEIFRVNEFISIPIGDLVGGLLLLFEGLAFVLEEHESQISKQYRQCGKDIHQWNLEMHDLHQKSIGILDKSKIEAVNSSAVNPQVTSMGERVEAKNEMINIVLKIAELNKKVIARREASKPLEKIINDFKSHYGPGYLGADRTGRGYWVIKIKEFRAIIVDENHFILDHKEEKISFITNVQQLGQLMVTLDPRNSYDKELLFSLKQYVSNTEDGSSQNRYIELEKWLMTLKKLPITPPQSQSYFSYYSKAIKLKLLDIANICKFTQEMKNAIMIIDKEPFETYKFMLTKWYNQGRFAGGTNYRMQEFFHKVQSFSHFYKWLLNFKRYYSDGVLHVDDVEEVVKLKPKMIMNDIFGESSELDELEGPVKFSPAKARKKVFKYRMENDVEGESEDDYEEKTTDMHQSRMPRKATYSVDDLGSVSERSVSDNSSDELTRKSRNGSEEKLINERDVNNVDDQMEVYSNEIDDLIISDVSMDLHEKLFESDELDEPDRDNEKDVILDYSKMKVATIECPSLVFLN
jgi:hypothetical protein